MSDYFREVGTTELLQADEERDLARRVAEGDIVARDHFVRANLRLVVMVARQFLGRGLGLDDLVQEGNLGLVHAVEQFDPEHKVRFSTYARYWIHQSIQQAIERSGPTIRVPGYAVDLVNKWRRSAKELHNDLGRAPTDEEIAAALQLAPKQLKIIKKALSIYSHPHGSPLDAAPEGAPMQDVAGATQPAQCGVEQAEEMQQVLHVLDQLEDREAAIIRLRFGLGGEEPLSLREVGLRLDLTRERVRQIERQALATMQEWLGADDAP